MAWEAPLDADIPWARTRRQYDQDRREAYRVARFVRIDLNPTPVPPGATLVPIDNQIGDHPPGHLADMVLPPGWLREATSSRGDRADLRYTGRIGRYAPGLLPLAFTADLTRFTFNGDSRYAWATSRMPVSPGSPSLVAVMNGSPPRNKPGVIFRRSDNAVIGHVTDDGAIVRADGTVAAKLPRLPADPAAIPLTDLRPYDPTWWYSLPWADGQVVFLPPFVMGQYGWEEPEIHPLPDVPGGRYVAIPWPHRYLRDLPPPIAIYHAGTMSGNNGADATRTIAIYESPFLITGRGDRQRPNLYPLPDKSMLVSGTPPADAKGVWFGHAEDEEKGSPLRQARDALVQTAARVGGVEALLIGLDVVSAGIAGSVVGAAIETAPAASAGASASGGGAIAAPGSATTQLAADVAHAVAAPTVEAAQASAGGQAVSAAVEVATSPVGAAAVSVAAPDATNKVLEVAAVKVTPLLDALGPIPQVYDLGLDELAIRAQRTQAKRDEMRLELAARRAENAQKSWFRGVQTASGILTGLALAAGGATIVSSLLSAAKSSEVLVDGLEQVKAKERAAIDAASAEEAELDAAIAHELEVESAATVNATPPEPPEELAHGLVAPAPDDASRSAEPRRSWLKWIAGLAGAGALAGGAAWAAKKRR